MGRRRRRSSREGVCAFLAAFLLLQLGLAAAQNASPWLTLSGNAPAIIAKGGFSGLFPDSSSNAYTFVSFSSSNDTTLWCDVQLTKDGIGICVPDINLDNCTDIGFVYPQNKTAYVVNGVNTTGWFSVDYNMNDLSPVSLKQPIYSRTFRFDSLAFPILPVDLLGTQINHSSLWLNVQHNAFYMQHNLSMRNFLLSEVRRIVVDYVSSPEVAFLSGIAPRLRSTKTKLIFHFLDKSILEPSTNQTYGLLLSNLTFIKTFASGILVPKNYIWPVTTDNYLLPSTSIVMDAHKAGLEIYAADFANDNILSFNYSYDPLAEYLRFFDNRVFSVDGVVTDSPITPSEAIGCFSQLNQSSVDHGKPLIISHNGASGDYADCTDLAYQKAIDEGADVIDCPVQVTQDGHLICMSSVDLLDDTTVTKSQFSSQFSNIPQLKNTPGIFTFNLTWNQIQKNLKPIISQPFSSYGMVRNPRYKNSGSFLSLADFLTFARDKPLSGVLILIEHAAFMAQRLSFSVVDSVIAALNDAGYNKTTLDVMIQSSDSAVLVRFKQLTNYKLVYQIEKSIRDAVNSSVADIRTFANAVALDKQSIYPSTLLFTTGETGLVSQFQAAGLDVYAYVLCNEFVSQPWDFLSDATVEINAYVVGAGVDGIITDFPGTARRYKRNSCRNLGSNAPNYMQPIQAGQLLTLMTPSSLPPALSPIPPLTVSDVVEPPLPSASRSVAPGASPSSLNPSSGQRNGVSLSVSLLMACGFLLV
ncbi:glycerophosphodiester phosphodiesterase GDPDL4-like [Zingiber officinale]|uniref:glycerophosphodiester phosphodiesterase GDPDL4-like n=1 Tax=Zingiber officinale TaxID=94328 RepID=UPI001C4B7278|nr:glycerophosphodiester phosphodiesterase GDPDL4-like [Zingiber officinale]